MATLCWLFQIKERATDGLRLFITHYRDDPDQQNLIDWIQEDWLQCCGIDGPNDWDNNNYFNCSSMAVRSREACGVPFSCCKRQLNQVIRNKQCGYDVRRESNVSKSTIEIYNCIGIFVYNIAWFQNDLSRTINEKGCVQAGEEWVERNLISISATVIVLAFLQVSWLSPSMSCCKPQVTMPYSWFNQKLKTANNSFKSFPCSIYLDLGHLFYTKPASRYIRTKV